MVRHFGRHAPASRMMLFGTGGRTRTGTLFTAGDFESPVSTNFTTPAESAGAAGQPVERARL